MPTRIAGTFHCASSKSSVTLGDDLAAARMTLDAAGAKVRRGGTLTPGDLHALAVAAEQLPAEATQRLAVLPLHERLAVRIEQDLLQRMGAQQQSLDGMTDPEAAFLRSVGLQPGTTYSESEIDEKLSRSARPLGVAEKIAVKHLLSQHKLLK